MTKVKICASTATPNYVQYLQILIENRRKQPQHCKNSRGGAFSLSAENGHEVIDDVQELPGIDEKRLRNWLKIG